MKIIEELLFYGIRLFFLAQCGWGIRSFKKNKLLRGLLILIAVLLSISIFYSVLCALGWDGVIGSFPSLVLFFGSELPLRQAISWLLGTEA